MQGWQQRSIEVSSGGETALVKYYRAGEGCPVLLLHGWGVDCQTFDPVAGYLKDFFTVYALDFPGFGASPPPPAVWGVESYADAVEDFCRRLDIQKPILLGHSFGGRVSIVLGARGIPAKIVLLDSAGVPPKRGMDYYCKVYTYKAAKKLLSLPGLSKQKEAYLLKNNRGSADYQAAQGVMKDIFVKVVNQDLRPFMPQIAAPTLLVWGDADTATPLSDGKEMERLIKGSGLVVFNGAGHYAFLERLPQFLLVLDSFFAQDKTIEENDR